MFPDGGDGTVVMAWLTGGDGKASCLPFRGVDLARIAMRESGPEIIVNILNK